MLALQPRFPSSQLRGPVASDSQQLPEMDTQKAIQTYLDKMFTEVGGMKVLLLDAHTVRLILAISHHSV